ncbi:hypothetical protein D3C81_2036250 [compost metagenome]
MDGGEPLCRCPNGGLAQLRVGRKLNGLWFRYLPKSGRFIEVSDTEAAICMKSGESPAFTSE